MKEEQILDSGASSGVKTPLGPPDQNLRSTPETHRSRPVFYLRNTGDKGKN